MAWVEPKTDWAPDDYYNYGDLNRVETNTAHLASLLEQLGQPVPLTYITNRDRRRFEFFDSLNRIESNIKALADNFYAPEGWEQPKTTWASLQRFDYRDANRLEHNLLLLYELIQNVIENMKYCGTFTCGEEDLI